MLSPYLFQRQLLRVQGEAVPKMTSQPLRDFYGSGVDGAKFATDLEAIASKLKLLKSLLVKGFREFHEKLSMAFPKLKKLCYSYG